MGSYTEELTRQACDRQLLYCPVCSKDNIQVMFCRCGDTDMMECPVCHEMITFEIVGRKSGSPPALDAEKILAFLTPILRYLNQKHAEKMEGKS